MDVAAEGRSPVARRHRGRPPARHQSLWPPRKAGAPGLPFARVEPSALRRELVIGRQRMEQESGYRQLLAVAPVATGDLHACLARECRLGGRLWTTGPTDCAGGERDWGAAGAARL